MFALIIYIGVIPLYYRGSELLTHLELLNRTVNSMSCFWGEVGKFGSTSI